VIVSIIAVAGYRLIPSALKNRWLQIMFIVAIGALILLDVPEVIVMLGAGVVYALWITGGAGIVSNTILFWGGTGTTHGIASQTLSLQAYVPLMQAANGIPVSLWEIFWYFLRIGAVLFGSGYVLIAYIQQDLVNTFGWLTSQQLLDAVAIGQFTPGPVSTTAAVVGYIVSGLPGAVVATVGIFLPSFVLVILSAPLIPKMRRSKFMGAFLDGVNAGVLAAITVTVVDLARAALIPLGDGVEAGAGLSVIAVILFAAALIAQIRFRINATWLLVIGGVIGFVVGTV
jgi:chromate transporter